MTTCQHEYEIRYSRTHAGKVAECPTCEKKFVNGEEVVKTAPPVLTILLTEEKPLSIENKKVVSAVATINALTAEEYALVMDLTARKVEKVKKERKARKTRGLPAAEAPKAE